MRKVTVEHEIDVPAAAVWACLASVDGIENWSPPSLSSVKTGFHVGAKRIVTFEQGDLYEEVREVDHENMIFAYAVLVQPLFPLKGEARGRVQVFPGQKKQTKVRWEVEFDIDEEHFAATQEAVHGLYSANIMGIESYLKEFKSK
ncbi:MAG: SRPBCC family protein [Thermonemataceae bacterium]